MAPGTSVQDAIAAARRGSPVSWKGDSMTRACRVLLEGASLTLRLDAVPRGGHLHISVWVGPDRDHLALAGTLCVRSGEWGVMRRVLRQFAI